MNRDTGEMVEISEGLQALFDNARQDEYLPRSMFPASPPTKKKDVVTFNVGDVVEVMGGPCEVVHIDPGGQQFSLRPLAIMPGPGK